MSRNYQAEANAAANARRKLEAARERVLILSYRSEDGTFRHAALLAELNRREGRPLDPAMVTYWVRRVTAVLAGEK